MDTSCPCVKARVVFFVKKGKNHSAKRKFIREFGIRVTTAIANHLETTSFSIKQKGLAERQTQALCTLLIVSKLGIDERSACSNRYRKKSLDAC